MRKQLFALYFLVHLIYSSPAESIDYNALLGFNGLFKENSWTPLQIRLQNNGPSVSADLVVITDNSSTTKDQIREYRKPLDLPSGSNKTISFTLPIGHHNRDLQFYLQSDEGIILEDTIELKQRGIRENFILSISPYPDLDIQSGHPVLHNRIIAFPHPDLLPDNSFAYDSVHIVSIHREYFDTLSNRQFEALTAWVSTGGVLVVWGGKSPAHEKRNYLPCRIDGLQRIGSLLINKITVPEENLLELPDSPIKAAVKMSGSGTVFFFPFDYSGTLNSWPGLSDIWTLIDSSVRTTDTFVQEMDNDYLLEDYITMFDASEFNYLDRLNVALIMFLSASLIVSLIIFIRLRRKSSNLYKYLTAFMFSLMSASVLIFILLYNSNSRNECFALDVNVLYQQGISDKSRYYKDLLIGSSAKTESRITFPEMTSGVIKRGENENLIIINKPETEIDKLKLNPWSSKIYRLEYSVQSVCDVQITDNGSSQILTVTNKSDFFLRDSFFVADGSIYRLGGILPNSVKDFPLSSGHMSETFSDSPLLQVMADYYTTLADIENQPLFGSFTTENMNPVRFSNEIWKKRTETLVLYSLRNGGITHD